MSLDIQRVIEHLKSAQRELILSPTAAELHLQQAIQELREADARHTRDLIAVAMASVS